MACSLESFEIRFGRADFCCAVGFRPHLALSFEPISETIIIPLTALNAETCSIDLGCGRAINYVTSGNVRDSAVQINLLEKNDFDEFQKIGFAHFRLRNGSYEGSLWFNSIYDSSFELGTIDVCAKIILKNASYSPVKVKKRPKSSTKRPKTAPKWRSRAKHTENAAKNIEEKILDIRQVQPESKFLKNGSVAEVADVGAHANAPPALFYKSAKCVSSEWQHLDTQSILEKLKNGTEQNDKTPTKPVEHRVLFTPPPPPQIDVSKLSSADLGSCPLVAQILSELSLLSTTPKLTQKTSNSLHESAAEAIETLKMYFGQIKSPTNDELEQASTVDDRFDTDSTVPIATRRHTAPAEPSGALSCGSLHPSNSRLRQNVHSGTYDRYGRPTFKPVYSDISIGKPFPSEAMSIEKMVEKEVQVQSSFSNVRSANLEQKSTQTDTGGGLRQQTVLQLDIGGTAPPPPPTPTPRSTNHSTKTSVHISMPSVTASDDLRTVSQTSLRSSSKYSQSSAQYSDDFDEESSDSSISEHESIFEKSEVSRNSFKMIPQRSRSPELKPRSARKPQQI